MKNYIAIVLDESGSMQALSKKVKQLYSETVNQLKEEAAKSGQETYLTLVQFSYSAQTDFSNRLISNVSPTISYVANGQTALLDGVGNAVESLSKIVPETKWVMVDPTTQKLVKDDISYLVITLTDGGENNSSKYSASNFAKLIKEKQAEGNWTFAFSVPDSNGKSMLQSFGVPSDNIKIWEVSEKGMDDVTQSTSLGIGRYYTSRSAGGSSVQSFYTPDLSTLNPQDLKNNLINAQGKYKVLDVNKECDVTTFIRENTGEYVKGNTYYQLTKSEKIQANKKILIREKNKAAIYEGAEARKIIGIPEGADCRVRPGNMSNYDVFVQSSSNNRKLVRGTKVIVKKS